MTEKTFPITDKHLSEAAHSSSTSRMILIYGLNVCICIYMLIIYNTYGYTYHILIHINLYTSYRWAKNTLTKFDKLK